MGNLRDEPNPDSALSPVTSLGWSRPLAGGSGSSAVEVTAVSVGPVSEAISTVAESMVAAVVVGLGVSLSLPLGNVDNASRVGDVATSGSISSSNSRHGSGHTVAVHAVDGRVVGVDEGLSLPLAVEVAAVSS